jgi:hypothetical protein
MKTTPILRLVVAVIASGVYALPVWAQPCGKLLLEEIITLAVPDHFAISGAFFDRNGKIVLWSTESARAVRLDSMAWRNITLPNNLLPNAVSASPQDTSVLEALDGNSRSLRRFQWNGGEINRSASIDIISSLSASRSHDGWYLGGYKSDSVYAVLHVPYGDAPEFTWGEPILLGEIAIEAGTDFRLSVAPDGAWLTRITYPFAVFHVSAEQGVQVERDTVKAVTLTSDERNSELLVSLPVLSLDCGYVQVIADLTSDDRVSVRAIGRQEDPVVSVIRAPIGFVASDPERAVLAAVRNVGVPELVLYRWSWGR